MREQAQYRPDGAAGLRSILLIEDDPYQVEHTRDTLLKAFPACSVTVVTTESEFRHRFPHIADNPPSAVITGMMMPWAPPGPEFVAPPPDVAGDYQLAGLRCIDILAQDRRTQDIPIVIYSMLTASDIRAALPRNVVHLSKSADTKPLLSALRSFSYPAHEGQERGQRPDELMALAVFDSKLRLISLTPDARYWFIDDGGHASKILYLWSAEARAYEEAVQELEDLVNSANVREKDLQDFFERHEDFIKGTHHKKAHPHLVLQRDKDGPLIPDFVLEPVDQNRFCDLLELKLPSANLFVMKADRERFSAAVFEACAQLRSYRQYFDEERNRRSFKARYQLSAYRPHMVVVIGRRGSVNPLLARDLEDVLPRQLHLRTYDDVLARAKGRLASMKARRI